MANITPEQIVLAGIVPTYETCTPAGDEFVNSGLIVIHIKNANGSLSRTVTIDNFTACNFGLTTEHDEAVVVVGPGESVIGPFPKARFNDAEGKVQLTYSDSAADLSVAVVELP